MVLPWALFLSGARFLEALGILRIAATPEHGYGPALVSAGPLSFGTLGQLRKREVLAARKVTGVGLLQRLPVGAGDSHNLDV